MTATKRLLLIGSALYAAHVLISCFVDMYNGVFADIFASYPTLIGILLILSFVFDPLAVLLPSFLCLRRDFAVQRKTPAVWLLIISSFNLICSILVFITAIPRYLTLSSIGLLSLITDEVIRSLFSYVALILLLIASIRCLRIPQKNIKDSRTNSKNRCS
ncbi:MAG: hypothetical protein IKU56_02900 [Clostridia bacterium]|nr:hypothetical protein [Clostridia bacterium]